MLSLVACYQSVSRAESSGSFRAAIATTAASGSCTDFKSSDWALPRQYSSKLCWDSGRDSGDKADHSAECNDVVKKLHGDAVSVVVEEGRVDLMSGGAGSRQRNLTAR